MRGRVLSAGAPRYQQWQGLGKYYSTVSALIRNDIFIRHLLTQDLQPEGGFFPYENWNNATVTATFLEAVKSVSQDGAIEELRAEWH